MRYVASPSDIPGRVCNGSCAGPAIEVFHRRVRWWGRAAWFAAGTACGSVLGLLAQNLGRWLA